MFKFLLVVALFGAAAAVEESTQASMYNYGKTYKAGEWSPPPPPKKESPHLGELERIPPPTDELIEIIENMPKNGRKLLSEDSVFLEEEMSGGEAAGGSKKVPHNWFGTGRYVAPKYAISTGKEECDVCKKMIAAGVGPGVGKSGGEASADASKVLCAEVGPDYLDMCMGYSEYMRPCPSFVHNICHEDIGGSERLRAPCPDFLKCYYCLRINPLYCLE